MSKSTDADDYRKLRELLTAARIEADLTQAQVAAKLGRPQSFVSKYENGARQLGAIELLQICDALGGIYLDLAIKLAKAHGR